MPVTGTAIEAGLPNITGEVIIGYSSSYLASGAFEVNGHAWNLDGGNNHVLDKTIFDASLSNSIYGKATTVQPPAVTMRYIIKY